MDKVTKKFGGIELKADGDEAGSVKAIISTFGVIDRDGDIVMPSAFKDGQEIKMCSWGHNWGGLPVGKGTISVTDKHAIFEGQFFLDTEAGKETYKTVKNLGDLQEWSWGFQILQARKGEVDGRKVRFIESTEAYEVSPVLVGANPATATLDIKGAKDDGDGEQTNDEADASSEAETKTENTEETAAIEVSTVDDSVEAKGLQDNVSVINEQIKDIMIEVLGREETRSWDVALLLDAMRCLEYFASDEDWRDYAAEMHGDAEKALSLFKERAGKLKELGAFANDEDETEPLELPYSEHGEKLLADVSSFIDRSRLLAEMRSKGGRKLGVEQLARIKSVRDELTTIASNIDTLFFPVVVEDQPAPTGKSARDANFELAKRKAKNIGDE